MEPCCADPANLELRDSDKPDLTLRICRLCGRRHFELSMDAGIIGLTGARLG